MDNIVYDVVNRIGRMQEEGISYSSFSNQVPFLDNIKESYTMYFSRFGRQQSIFISVMWLAILVLLLTTLSASFSLGKESKNKLKYTNFLWKSRSNKNKDTGEERKAVGRNKDNDDGIDDDDDNSSRGSISSSGSAFTSLRRAPELVRQNLAHMIKNFSWDDLSFWSPLYLLLPSDDIDTDSIADLDDDEEFYYDEVVVEPAASLEIDFNTKPNTIVTKSRRFALPKNTTTITHFCFLVHGHRGMSRDLSYMQSVMRKQAKIQQRRYVRSYLRKQKVDRQHNATEEKVQETDEVILHQKIMEDNNNNIHSPLVQADDLESSQHSVTEQSIDCSLGSDSDYQSESHAHSASISGATKSDDKQQSFIVPELVVHSPSCNEKKTDDGVIPGGDRLVEDILAFIREYMLSSTKLSENSNIGKLVDITISLVGNSFGGLYSRYAVAKISEMLQSKNDTEINMVLDSRYRVHFNVFCTTATPHLGLAGHTYVPLPRSAEFGVAAALGESGRDLFRLNPLLLEMATEPYYLHPLGHFRKRIAYANAYGTDFPVPVRTAAFLSEDSTYPHHFESRKTIDSRNELLARDGDSNQESSTSPVTTNEFVVATLHTMKESSTVVSNINRESNDDQESLNQVNMSTVSNTENIGESERELAKMSASLDSLGWTKVFVDVRKQIPRIAISKSLLPSLTSSLPSTETDGLTTKTSAVDASSYSLSPFTSYKTSSIIGTQDSNPSSTNPTGKTCIDQLKEKGVVPSKDVAAAVATTTPLLSTDQDEISLQWPLGHNMMVAFSRSKWSAYMNKAGRPVVDSLAKELVDDIFAFSWKER
jgi:Putative serine esterase (DUF676)